MELIVMRKVNLNMNEQTKYEVIKKLVEEQGNKRRAAVKLGCTVRHINRMIQGYKKHGKEFFVHGNKDRKPAHALSEKVKHDIIDFYNLKYYGANFTHYSELLLKHENISVSPSTIRSILTKEHILSPKTTRRTKKRIKKELEDMKKATTKKKEKQKITEKIISIEDAHPRRPRCAYFGEMVQMDASVHLWFGPEKVQLHIAIDDATSTIIGAYFDTQETLNGYYNVLNQILTQYGIPSMFYTDRRTVFEYKKKNSTAVEEDSFTQFSYACKQLGIDIKTTSVPQAKGRVERAFDTLQSRLPIELRLEGVTTIEQANAFLKNYIKEHNKKFALPINNTTSVFVGQPSDEEINLTLAVLSERKIDNGHCVKFKKKYFKPLDTNGVPVYYHKGTKCLVIESFDKQLFLSTNDKIYALEEIPEHEHISKNFDFPKETPKTKKRYIPPMDHPWRRSIFKKHMNSQKHREQAAS